MQWCARQWCAQLLLYDTCPRSMVLLLVLIIACTRTVLFMTPSSCVTSSIEPCLRSAGILFVTSRILVVDMLQKRIPTHLVTGTGLIVPNTVHEGVLDCTVHCRRFLSRRICCETGVFFLCHKGGPVASGGEN